MSPAAAGGARRATANSTPVPTSEGVKSVGGYFPVPPVDHYAERIEPRRPSLRAFTNPTVNSYHRLVPGFEAPMNLVYSARNRSACIRIPLTGNNPKVKRLEFRCPGSSGNPYLAFSARMMAGMDGIKNKIEPLLCYALGNSAAAGRPVDPY
ncbi:MAG: glutamine synthetase [Pseudonocardiales bacterium]|nr:glutamine synthetase [Pseudonocardiales bacterium]